MVAKNACFQEKQFIELRKLVICPGLGMMELKAAVRLGAPAATIVLHRTRNISGSL